jgi:hypothetical protein
METTDTPLPPDRSWVYSLGALAIVVLCIGGLATIRLLNGAFDKTVDRAQDVQKLRTLQQALAEVRALRDRGASDAEWEAAESSILTRTKPLIDDLKNTANRKQPAKQCLLWAARDTLPRFLKFSRTEGSPVEVEFEAHLREAAKLLDVPWSE